MNNSVNTALEQIHARREHLLNQLGNQDLVKSISTEEFKQKYGTEHEVYTAKTLTKFINDSVEKNGGETPELIKSMQDQFATLSDVVVKEGSSENPTYVKYFVRPMNAE